MALKEESTAVCIIVGGCPSPPPLRTVCFRTSLQLALSSATCIWLLTNYQRGICWRLGKLHWNFNFCQELTGFIDLQLIWKRVYTNMEVTGQEENGILCMIIY